MSPDIQASHPPTTMESKPRLGPDNNKTETPGGLVETVTESLALLDTTREYGIQRTKRKQHFSTEISKMGFYGVGNFDSYDYCEDNVKQLDNVFHMKDDIDVNLSLPGISEHPNPEPVQEAVKGTKRRNSFMKRLSAFTGGSPSKATNSSERQRRNSSASGFQEFRRFSRSSSANTQSTEPADMSAFASSPTSTKSTQTQRSSGSQSMFSKYIRPSSWDSVSFGLDFTDSNDMGDIASPSFSFDSSLDEEHQIVVLQKKVENIRKITNTEIRLRSLNDIRGATRPNDPRMWYTRNLRCAKCVGACPVCDIGCCLYETSRRLNTNPDTEMYLATHAEKLVMNIDALGAHVKDTGTFSLCSKSGGCGRYVCPECCGICPCEMCRDTQCKSCKPDPWGPCDWHD